MADITKSHVSLTWALGAAIAVASSAFSAGVAVTVFGDKIRADIGDAVAPVTSAAKAAQADAFSLRQDMRQLRLDLARGAGRCLARDPSASARDWAGKAATSMYERELAEGVPADAALRHVFESDF